MTTAYSAADLVRDANLFVNDLHAEVSRARTKFPSNEKLLAALMEEVGEVARALLQGKSHNDVRAECVQVAAVALRLAAEGDSDFTGFRSLP